jgi:hypothetical protein
VAMGWHELARGQSERDIEAPLEYKLGNIRA